MAFDCQTQQPHAGIQSVTMTYARKRGNRPPRWTSPTEVQDSKHPFLPAHLVQAVPESVTNGYDKGGQIPTRIVDGTFDLYQHCLLTMWTTSTAC